MENQSQEQPQLHSTDSGKCNSFECSNIHKQIFKNLQFLHESKECFDLILIGKNNIEVQAHRIIVCAFSRYFHIMPKIKKPMRIEVKEFDADTLKTVVQFIYTGSVELCINTVRPILEAAYRFKIQQLIDLCFAFMIKKLSKSNCLETTIFAKKHDYSELFEKCLCFTCKLFEEICFDFDFLDLNYEMLNVILSSDKLFVLFEEKVVNFLLKWLDHNREDREEDWKRLLSNVRYQFLTHTFIIENSDRICINLECHKLIRYWLEWHLLPEKQSKNQSDSLKPRKSYQTEKLILVKGNCSNNLQVMTYYPEFNTLTCKMLPTLLDKISGFRAIVDNGVIFITGGVKKDKTRTNEVKFFNIKTEETGFLPSMKNCRSEHAVAVLNGFLYVIGGIGQWQSSRLTSVERYDFSKRTWEDVAPLLRPSATSRATVLNDCLYLVNANLMQCYSVKNDRWCFKANKTEKCESFSLISIGEFLFTVGGIFRSSESSKFLITNIVERYNPSTDTWKTITISSFCVRPLLFSSKSSFIVVGEKKQNNLINILEEYNIKTNEWKTLAPLVFQE